MRKKRNYFKRNQILFLSFLFLFFSVLLLGCGFLKRNETSLHEIILEGNEVGINGFVDITYEPYVFAYFDNDFDEYYFVFDENYIYIAKMSAKTYEKLKNASFEKPKHIVGKTYLVPEELKKISIDAYNQVQNTSLSLSDFEDYFGKVYINLEEQDTKTQDIFFFLSLILGMFGVFLFLSSFFHKKK